MSRAFKASFRLVVSIVLLTAAALAHTTSNNVDKNRNREHHSRLSKLAFWRSHKDHGKAGGRVAKVNQNKNREQHNRASKLAFWHHHKHGDKSAKTAQANPASVKPAGQHARSAAGKGPSKTTSAAAKAKPRQTTEERTAASLKQ